MFDNLLALSKCVHLPYLRHVSPMTKIYGLLQALVVGPVLKITDFRGFEPNKIRDFESLQRLDKKFYGSVHELYCQ